MDRRPGLIRVLTIGIVVAALSMTTMPAGAGTADDIGTEIVGGSTAAPGEFPYQVALLTRGVADPYNAEFCGGSVISATAVLTAAHCVENETAAGVDVLAGTVDLAPGTGQRVPATRIHLHPRWNTNSTVFDAAIVEVATPLTSTPVEVVAPGQEHLLAPGTNATVTGWGVLSESGGYPTALRKVTVPITTDATCAATYGGGYQASSMVCAGLPQGGKDSCQGDSGGPLAVRSSGQWVQVGIVSFGDGCARPNAPGVYSRVSALSAFISPFVGERPHPFTDVGAWLTDAVAWASENGHMSGFPDSTFRPGDRLSRAEAIRLLWRLAGEPAVTQDHGFSDVPAWVAAAVRWAALDPDGAGPAQPVVNGFPDGSFRPDADITRGEWTHILHEAAGHPASSSAHAFGDVPAWISDAVAWISDPARDPQYATGFGDGTYRPEDSVTRGQATRAAFRINA